MSTFGEHIKISLFGESHGPYIGITISNYPSGITLDHDLIQKRLSQRKAKSIYETKRVEQDLYTIISGYFEDKTTGTPLTFLIPNEDMHATDYKALKHVMRPSHSDLGAHFRYVHYDHRGGGHFSARLTAPLVILGAICEQILTKQNIKVVSHIQSILELEDDPLNKETYLAEYDALVESDFAVLNPKVKEAMQKEIQALRKEKDSAGGIIETMIYNMPRGVGTPYFASLESTLSHLLFSIGGVKGISFGSGFDITRLKGSQSNDSYYYDDKKHIQTKTFHNGGIVGGISIGQPIRIQTAFKAPSSISKAQHTIDIQTEENAELTISGRHDACYLARACVVVNSLLYYGILEAISKKEGSTWMI